MESVKRKLLAVTLVAMLASLPACAGRGERVARITTAEAGAGCEQVAIGTVRYRAVYSLFAGWGGWGGVPKIEDLASEIWP
jgi:hypothetical protein